MVQTVGELGEFGLIQALTQNVPGGPAVEVGPGDDAAVLAIGGGRTVATTDLLVEGTHFRRDWSSAVDVGHKAAAQNLADVVAMGADPVALLVGLALPSDLSADWVRDLYRGIAEECQPLQVSLAGGDVVAATQVAIAVTALGQLVGAAPLTRSGAQPGDVVAVSGRLGWSAGGFAVLSRGFRSPRVLVDAHRRPDVPYDAGRQAVAAGATAMCDVSDGLLADLGHVARASGVTIDVDTSLLEIADPLVQVAGALGSDPLAWVLSGGEDHAMVATFPTPPPAPWVVVGRVGPHVEAATEAETAGLVSVDGTRYDEKTGHAHFR